MAYKIISTAPEVRSEQQRLEAARQVYEELLRYIQASAGTTAD